jgi:hypothetical protein
MDAVLILAYRRWENIEKIFNRFDVEEGTVFYVHIDKGKDYESERDASAVFKKVLAYREFRGLEIHISRPKSNQGIAVSMIASIDRIFESHSELIVLEDDCLPGDDFIKFMKHSFDHMGRNPEIALACGAQFGPPEIVAGEWVLSRYPLNWGWGITKTSWEKISRQLLSKNGLKSSQDGSLNVAERVYWNAGSRRALEGFVDVWDTILVRELLRSDSLVLLPGKNLVENTGNEEFATHTRGKQLWINFPIGEFVAPDSAAVFSRALDYWFRKKFFGISQRHLISTKVTLCRDRLRFKNRPVSLMERIQEAEINFDL